MPAPSLLQLSTAAAVRNMKYLDDIGSIPYALARPFLLKIESPEKLRYLEIQSPHIMQDDNEIWLGFIKRDIPKWERYDIPEKPESWYDIYCDLRERVQKEVDKDAEQLKMAMEGINSQRAKHSSKFVSDVRLPQQKPSARQRYATYDRKVGGIAPVFTAPSAATLAADPLGAPTWTFERPQIPRSSESKKKSSIFAAPKRNKALAVPTNKLNNKASQVRVAPRSLIEEHRRPAEPPMAMRKPTPILRVPGRPKTQTTFGSTNPTLTPSLEEKEARLRALTTGRPIASRTSKSPEANSVSSKTLPRSSPPASSFRYSPTSSPVRKVPKPSPARTKSQVTPAPKSPSTTTPTTDSTESLFEEPDSQDNIQEPNQMKKPPSPGLGSDRDESKSQAPRVAPIRKRPAPNVFIQPKKRKVT